MRRLWAMLVVVLAAGAASAQELSTAPADTILQLPAGDLSLGQVRSPVLTIDPDRLFVESLFGQRVNADLRREATALDLENQRIEAALTAEERGLTLRRPTMPVADFRIEADAFDARVQGIRQAQDAKERSLQQAVGVGKQAFLDAATPILAQIMIDSGAAVILDRRSVFLGVGIVDVTDRAIAEIDAALGDGAQLAIPETGAPADQAPVETQNSPPAPTP